MRSRILAVGRAGDSRPAAASLSLDLGGSLERYVVANGSSHSSSGKKRGLGAVELLIAALIILAGLGAGITDLSSKYGFWYWVAMVPVFGSSCTYAAWSRARARGEVPAGLVQYQILHWLGLLGIVCLIYMLVQTGRMANQDAGLVALLALALATYLSGVHADWRVAVVGFFLGLVVIAVALIEQFMWILLVLVVIAVVIGVFFWRTGRE